MRIRDHDFWTKMARRWAWLHWSAIILAVLLVLCWAHAMTRPALGPCIWYGVLAFLSLMIANESYKRYHACRKRQH